MRPTCSTISGTLPRKKLKGKGLTFPAAFLARRKETIEVKRISTQHLIATSERAVDLLGDPDLQTELYTAGQPKKCSSMKTDGEPNIPGLYAESQRSRVGPILRGKKRRK